MNELRHSTIIPNFSDALIAHEENDLETARKLYKEFLILDPNNPEANYNLGSIYLTQADYDRSLKFFKLALEASPNVPIFWSSYIEALIKLNKISKAKILIVASQKAGLKSQKLVEINDYLCLKHQEPCKKFCKCLDDLINAKDYNAVISKCMEKIETYPKSAILFGSLARVNIKLKQDRRAIANLEKAIRLQPTWHEHLLILGKLYLTMSNYHEAIECFQNAIRINKNLAEPNYLIGKILEANSEIDESAFYFKKTANIDPSFWEAYVSLSNILIKQNKQAEALSVLEKAIKANANIATVYGNIAAILTELDRPSEALEYLDKAIKLDPNQESFYLNQSNTLCRMGSSEDAFAAVEKSLEINPNHVPSIGHHALLLSEKQDYHAAAVGFERAVEIQPAHADAHTSLSFELLRRGNFVDGWRHYEYRWDTEFFDTKYLETSKPRWSPPNNGGRVLLWSEQGLGDIILFASMIKELNCRCDQLIVQTDERLIPLFKRSFSSDIKYISTKHKVFECEYDTHIPIGSLGQFFREDLYDFSKSSGSYLKANLDLASKFRAKIQNDENTQIYGVTWSASSKNSFGREAINRNIPIDLLAKSISGENIRLVNLQYDHDEKMLEKLYMKDGIKIQTLQEFDNKMDIDCLASLICACDQVISADNSTVFLAASLGKRTSVLLPFAASWRWGTISKKSYWYDSVNLYRSIKSAGWAHPIKLLQDDLKMTKTM